VWAGRQNRPIKPWRSKFGQPSVTPDETGCKVEGQLWWMRMFSTPQVPVYAIQPGRRFEQAARILGAGFAGFLVRDRRAVYRRFVHALHQSCLAHLLRGCRGNDSAGGEAGSRVSASATSPVAASSATARSSSARTDQRPGRSRGPGTIGSQARSELATLLPLLAGIDA